MEYMIMKLAEKVLEANRKGLDLRMTIREGAIDIIDKECNSIVAGNFGTLYFKTAEVLDKYFVDDAKETLKIIERMVEEV